MLMYCCGSSLALGQTKRTYRSRKKTNVRPYLAHRRYLFTVSLSATDPIDRDVQRAARATTTASNTTQRAGNRPQRTGNTTHPRTAWPFHVRWHIIGLFIIIGLARATTNTSMIRARSGERAALVYVAVPATLRQPATTKQTKAR
ncbi:MADS box transcription factor [Anopheles sinensis]|uniref:MADS box transcription factor n=1 Tax=Anopheles sinensis TaxID=74873 RepID=A0A084W1D6_ANOSI|nr:MADS box transcription factor [Anopheles sinensis]